VWVLAQASAATHPPVLVGGNGPGTEGRVLAFGDEWLPQFGPLADMAGFRRRVTALRQRAADAGRGRIPVTVFGVPPDQGLLAEFAAAGADRCLPR
jgi:alkanesulfonate monooxygenase SsuD/methylene tetrahydromethanopterin reductase-like flavin-dependent oxidoreductase (luciferase family)